LPPLLPQEKLILSMFLKNVIVAKAYNSSHQEVIIQESANIINLHNIKIMIVDSVSIAL
jgi:DNA repair protein RadA